MIDLIKFLEYIKTEYSFDKIDNFVELESASENRIFLLSVCRKKYIVRMINDEFSLRQVVFSAYLSDCLCNELDIAPRVYKDSKGRYTSLFENKLVEVIQFCEHESVAHLEITHLLSAISLLSKFLNYSAKNYGKIIEGEKFRQPKFEITKELLASFHVFADKIGEKACKSLLGGIYNNILEIETDCEAALGNTVCIIHGDLHRDNFLFIDGKAEKIIDYDTAAYDSFYIDIAFFIIWTCFMDTNSNFRPVNNDLKGFLVKKIKRKLCMEIEDEHLNTFIVLLLIRRMADKCDDTELIIKHFINLAYEMEIGA